MVRARAALLLASVVVLLGVLTPSRTAAGPPDAVARAEKLYLEGAALYRAGSYQEAAATFERAYRVYPEPNLLYNMGRCYEALGRLEDAIERYGRFIADNRSAPPAKQKARARLELLRQLLAKTRKRSSQRAAPATTPSSAPSPAPSPVLTSPPRSALPPPTRPPAPPRREDRFSVSKWVVGLSALALCGGGVALFLWGHADHQRVQDAIDAAHGGVVSMPQSEAAALIEDGDKKKIAGYALLGAGGVALLTSAVLFAFGGEQEQSNTAPVALTLSPDGAVLSFAGRF